MDVERWKRVEDLLQSALRLPTDQQDEFLRQACADDAPLLQEVRSLLTSHRKVGSFLEVPVRHAPTSSDSHHGPDGFPLSRAGPTGQRGMGVVYQG